jgi:hypothetical protein
MMFNLTGGQVMYVPPIVANKIEAEGIGPGEPFELCKSQIKTGQRRSIEWSVEAIRSGRNPSEGPIRCDTRNSARIRAARLCGDGKCEEWKEPGAVSDSAIATAPSTMDSNGATVRAQPVSPARLRTEGKTGLTLIVITLAATWPYRASMLGEPIFLAWYFDHNRKILVDLSGHTSDESW